MISYITLNDSTSIRNSILALGNERLELNKINIGEFDENQRKTILGIGLQGDVSPPSKSSSKNSKIISSEALEIELTQRSQPYLELENEKIQLEKLVIPCGRYHVKINVWLDTPLSCMSGVPLEKQASIQYSQILFIEIIFATYGSNAHNKKSITAPIYDSFGNLGFFLADLDRMKEIVSAELGSTPCNLIDAFSETELANHLFEAGVLCLTWGITPWVYYVYSASEQSEIDQLPFKDTKKISGVYKISDKIVEMSLVPGDQLKNWPNRMEMPWPKMNISGQGNTLKLDLHVRNFNAPNGSHGPTLAMINIYRSTTNEEISPLLNIDIESIQ